MNKLQFKRLIREEIQKVLKEDRKILKEYYRDIDENVAILLTALKGRPSGAKYQAAKEIIDDIKNEFNVILDPTNLKSSVKAAQVAVKKNYKLEGELDQKAEELLDEFGSALGSRARQFMSAGYREL